MMQFTDTIRFRLLVGLFATICAFSSYAQDKKQKKEETELNEYWRSTPASALPKWSLEIKSGEFEADTLPASYLERKSTHNAIAVAYKILRTVEVGLEYGYSKEKEDLNDINGVFLERTTSRIRPAHAYVILRGIWGEDQIAVPYIGAGISETKYEFITDPAPGTGTSTTLDGTADGSNSRYGIQFLLDRMDPTAAAEFDSENGVNNLYLYIEKQEFDAKVNGIDYGGETVFAGLLFEF